MSQLAYIANIRLPTEKAHGFQICKMCEAFVGAGTAVTLYHPRRAQTPALIGKSGQDAFDYFGIPPTFQIHTIQRPIDYVKYQNRLPRRLLRWLLRGQTRAFTNSAYRLAKKDGAKLFYTRDVEVAHSLTRRNAPTIFEAHAVPKGHDLFILKGVLKRPSLKHIVVLTSFIKEALVEAGAPAHKILIEPDAVDLAQYANLPAPTEAKRQLNLPTDRPIIGYIGRFQTMGMDKGIAKLISAYAKLPSTLSPTPLLLCVGGPMDRVHDYLEMAKGLGVEDGRIRFIDRVPNAEVPLWMSAIDIATMPYPYTTHYAYYMSPMKLFEYMAAGKAIVSTNLPSIQEVLHHKKNGLLASHDDDAAFAQAIMKVLQNKSLKQRLEQAAHETAQKYTWQARAQRILEGMGHG